MSKTKAPSAAKPKKKRAKKNLSYFRLKWLMSQLR